MLFVEAPEKPSVFPKHPILPERRPVRVVPNPPQVSPYVHPDDDPRRKLYPPERLFPEPQRE